jgi:hypothetical protein
MALIFLEGDNPNVIFLQLIALSVGYLLSQLGLYYTHRFTRNPRPDEVLDKALKKEWQRGRLYHYILPAPHVLLTEGGPVILVAKYQGGEISAEGGKWRQRGVGLRRFFGQEGLGNPSRDAEREVSALASFIKKNAPEIAGDELPVGVIIVFTHAERAKLELEDADISAVHHSQLSRFLREESGVGEPLPKATYDSLQAAFDEAAQHVLDEQEMG